MTGVPSLLTDPDLDAPVSLRKRAHETGGRVELVVLPSVLQFLQLKARSYKYPGPNLFSSLTCSK